MKNLPEKLDAMAKRYDAKRWVDRCYDTSAAELSDLLKESARRIRALEHEVKLVG
jgi:hypothetical protein